MSPLGIPPDSVAVAAAHRTLMGLQARRIRSHRHPAAPALAQALADTALGREPPDEREWVDRIERLRAAIPFAMVAAETGSATGAGAEEGEPGPHGGEPTALGEAWAICRWASTPPVWGRFLLRLVRELSPASCLELGTGFGISAYYQGAALELNERGNLVTLDFNEAARIAEDGFSELGLDHRIELRYGDIDETLPRLLERIAPIDYVLLDAEHSEAATIRHFDAVLPYLADGAIAVLDDVGQTEGMKRAWRAVIGRERVQLSVPLRRLGVVAVAGGPGRAP